jgi:hypothetical protein
MNTPVPLLHKIILRKTVSESDVWNLLTLHHIHFHTHVMTSMSACFASFDGCDVASVLVMPEVLFVTQGTLVLLHL